MTAPLLDLLAWPFGQAPYAKQEEVHKISAESSLFALFMEQRCGKTPVCLGTLAHQFAKFLTAGGFGRTSYGPDDLLPKLLARLHEKALPGLPKKPSLPGMCYRPGGWANEGLDAMLVIAMPSGVPANWAEEIAKRIPKEMAPLSLVWSANKAGTKTFARKFAELIAHRGVACLLINGESIPTTLAKKVIGTFLRTRRALTVGDETTLICSEPGGVRSRVMEAISNLPGAVMRRILDGTPADEGPLKLFSQMRFLSTDILGLPTYTAYKAYYAEWEEKERHVNIKGKPTTIQKYPSLVRYANLEELQARLATYEAKPISFRVKRTDCFDIPNKVRSLYRFDLSAAQRKVYDPLRSEFEAELADGRIVTAPHVLARLTRLAQVASNYYPPTKIPTICAECQGEGCEACDDVGAIVGLTKKAIIDPVSNSRLDALNEVMSINKEPGIVWCRFTETVDSVMHMIEATNRKAVRYDGRVSPEEKLAGKAMFQAGLSNLFVAKASSAGRGLDLSAARWHCYVENEFSLLRRRQSEDRAEVSGRTFGTGIIDLVADDTEDDLILEAHAKKIAIADMVMGRVGVSKAEVFA